MSIRQIKTISAAIVVCVAAILIAAGLSFKTARADVGPKPSVHVTVAGIGDRVCYGTLLSYHKSTGPQSAWDGDPEHKYTYLDDDIWQAFVDYEDSDGYYFLQVAWLCTDEDGINWNYYPPSPFKILLYFPQTDAFAVSGVYERYAFNTYYKVTLTGEEITAERTESLSAKRNYDYTGEILSLRCRIIITIAIEICVALLFRLTQKRQLLSILCVNAITQIILNIILNVINFYGSVFYLLGAYLLGELIVFVLEATAYSVIFGIAKFNGNGIYKVSKPKCIAYALIANALSFIIGILLLYTTLIVF